MIVKPALVTFGFAVGTGTESEMPGWFAPAWQRARELGMKDIDDLPASDDGLSMVALRGVPRAGTSLHEAALWRTHDTWCLAALSAPDDDESTWTALDEQWPYRPDAPEQAEAAPENGRARAYVALAAGPLDVEATRSAIARAVPHTGGERRWTTSYSRTEDGILIWEAPAHRGERRLVVVAPLDAEPELNELCWSDGGGSAGLLIHYLLDDRRIRCGLALHDRESQPIRDLVRRTESAMDRLLAVIGRAGAGQGAIVAADGQLKRLQDQSQGVLSTLGKLRRLHHSVEVCMDNMRRAVPVGPGSHGPVAADTATARSLQDRLHDDIELLQITQDRAERVSTRADAAVQHYITAHQQQLTLVQSSFLGAIVMALAGVQSLQPRLEAVPEPYRLPLIAVLSTLALVLPGAVFRLSRRMPQDRKPGAQLFLTGVGLLGLSLGWLLAEIVSVQGGHGRAGHLQTLILAVTTAGALIVGVVIRMRTTRPMDPITEET